MTPPSTPIRCPWALAHNKDYLLYHDQKWGVPIHQDGQHFGMLTLEMAQARLSWQTILAKAAGYKTCFADLDIQKIAAFDEKKIQSLAQDSRIIRNMKKICATVHNPHCFLALQAT